MRKFYVYVLFRDEAKTDPFYVGKGHGARLNDHDALKEKGRRVNHHKNSTIRRCLMAFGHVPKAIFMEAMTEAEAFEIERYLIALWGRRDRRTGCLTNMTDGGEGTSGCIYTAEQRAKNSAARIGKPGPKKSLATREKIRLAHLGKPKSLTHRESLRKANLGKVQSIEARAKNSAANKGRIVTLETRKKLSEALTGRVHSVEHCANISAAKKGKKQSREVIERQVRSRAITLAGQPGPNAGKVFSQESRERMRQAQIKRWRERPTEYAHG